MFDAHEKHIKLLVHPWFSSVLLALASTLLVWGGYRIPFERVYDVGSGYAPIFDAYGVERNEQLSYVYADARVLLMVPQVGDGARLLELTLGGPGLNTAVPARLTTATASFELGAVRDLRTYSVLVPPERDGTLRLNLESDTVVLPGDNRPLGVLIDQVRVVAPAGAQSLFALLSAALFALTTTGVIGQMRGPTRVRLLLSAAVALAGAAAIVAARGRVELPPLVWQALAASFLLVTAWLIGSGWFVRVRGHVAVAGMFAVWRIGMWLVAGFGLWFSGMVATLGEHLSRDGNFYERDQIIWNTFVQGWTQWDSEHYTAIASSGYTFGGVRWPNVAFFPLYPLLLKPVAPLVASSYNTAGVIVANVAFLGALLLLYSLVVRDFGQRTALLAVLFVLIIPTSFFFGAVYSESLALLLLVAVLWAMRRQHWWLAGLAGFALALTRVPGVLVAPMIALCYGQSINWRWRSIRAPVLAAALPPLGLALFMAYQWQTFGTPTAFLQAQIAWENQMSLPWVLPVAMAEMIASGRAWPNVVFQGLFYVGFIALAVAALWRLPLAYGLTTALLLVPPFLSNWVWSVSRHVLIGIGAYIVLAQLAERRWVRWVLLAGMLPLLVLATLLFVNGWWIA